MRKQFISIVIIFVFSSQLLMANDTEKQEKGGKVVPHHELVGYLDYKKDVELNIEPSNSRSDTYLEGYLQALIDTQFHGSKVVAIVRNNRVYLANLPENRAEAKSIIAMVEESPGVLAVESQISDEEAQYAQSDYIPIRPKVHGIWFPQNTVLFPPCVADPRAVTASMAYRWQWKQASNYMGSNAAAVSYGDEFPIFRWINLGNLSGELQLGIEGGAWAVFRFDTLDPGEMAELINTDFYLGIPVSFKFDKWSFRFRLYHISGHLGDEFIVTNPSFERHNPSFEAIDLFAAYQVIESLRLYAGMGRVMHSDDTYHLQPLYFAYGGELRLFRRHLYYNRLYSQAFIAAYLTNSEARGWGTDQTYAVGYEWSKLRGAGRKFRIFGEFHNGFAEDGQFFKMRLLYLSLNFSYGF